MLAPDLVHFRVHHILTLPSDDDIANRKQRNKGASIILYQIVTVIYMNTREKFLLLGQTILQHSTVWRNTLLYTMRCFLVALVTGDGLSGVRGMLRRVLDREGDEEGVDVEGDDDVELLAVAEGGVHGSYMENRFTDVLGVVLPLQEVGPLRTRMLTRSAV